METGGIGTGNGFYAQSEIYGGRYARAKIILISERKGGKVSQAGWLAGWLALLRAGDIKYNHNNKRPRAGRHCWLRHPLLRSSLRLYLFLALSFSTTLIASTHVGDTHTRTYECAALRYYANIFLSFSLSFSFAIVCVCVYMYVRVYVSTRARMCPPLSQLYTRGLD